MLASVFAQALSEVRVGEIADLISASLDGVNQNASKLVDDLVGNAPYSGGNRGFPFPTRLQ